MNKGFIILTEEEMKAELRKAFIHGQGNAEMMEAGLERNEVEDYIRWRMIDLKKIKPINV